VYYAIGLVVLTVFIEFNSKNKSNFMMWKNADIYRYLTGKELEYFSDNDDEDDDGKTKENTEDKSISVSPAKSNNVHAEESCNHESP
jgi:hypothetical protein